jgi:hypothetical protein
MDEWWKELKGVHKVIYQDINFNWMLRLFLGSRPLLKSQICAHIRTIIMRRGNSHFISHLLPIQCTLDKTFSLDLPITDDHHINLPRLLCYYSNDLILNICIYLGRKCIHMSGFRILPLNVWERIMCVEVEVLKIFSLACGERLRYNIKIVSRVCMCAVDGMKAGMLLTIFNINILHLITSQFSLSFISQHIM